MFLAALSGWAGFLGTLVGVVSIQDRIHDAQVRVADAEAERELLHNQLLTTQRRSDELFQASQRLSQEREQIIRSLQEKIRDLEARLSKYEPIPRTGSPPP